MTTQRREGNLSSRSKRRSLIRRYARGNVSIQTDRFVTRKEKAERKKKILSFKFV